MRDATVEIYESAVWYVRGALHRALLNEQRIREALEKILQSENLAGTIKDQCEGMHAYSVQWSREMLDEIALMRSDMIPNGKAMERPEYLPVER